MVAKGRRFLSGVDELRSVLYYSHFINNEFWEHFLQAATAAIPPTADEEHYRTLCRYLNCLNHDLNVQARAELNYQKGVKSAVKFSSAALACAFAFANGTAILIGLAAGFCALAIGPWGTAAMGVGLTLISGLLACYCIYQVYKNVRLCRNSQLKEINDFVEHINPNPELVRTTELLPDNETLYPLFGRALYSEKSCC